MRTYFKEILTLKYFITGLLLIMILSYSVFLFLDEKMVARLGDEDNFFEWSTALCFLAASVVFWQTYRIKKNIWFLLFAVVFFVGFGEEISWGQRVIGFRTPEKLEHINVQKEFSIHNIEILNRTDLSGSTKHGFSRLLEINFIFKLFMIIYGVLIPLFAFHNRFSKNIVWKLKLPVPPVSIGILFIVNWLTFRVLLSYLLPSGYEFQYYDSDTEIFEFVSSAIILFISLYFNIFSHLEASMDIKLQLPETRPVMIFPELKMYFRRVVLLFGRKSA